jgi:hypothetical protein
MQQIRSTTATPVSNFNDLQIYGYDYDWKKKRLALAQGR